MFARAPPAKPSRPTTSRRRSRPPRTRSPRQRRYRRRRGWRPLTPHVSDERTSSSPRSGGTAGRPAPTERLAGDRAGEEGRAARRRRLRRWLPYLLLLPAVMLELLIHIVPMLVGIWMSFLKLTQFYIANWRPHRAPGSSNYEVALDFNSAVGRACCSRSASPSSSPSLVGRHVLGVRDGGGRRCCSRLPGPRDSSARCSSCPYALPVYAGGHHLELHAPAGHRRW